MFTIEELIVLGCGALVCVLSLGAVYVSHAGWTGDWLWPFRKDTWT